MSVPRGPFSHVLSMIGATLTCFWLCLQVAKSVSLRLYNELEVVQKKKSQLEWENEALREKTQELEVAKQVLQTEVEKVKEVQHHLKISLAHCYFTVMCELNCAERWRTESVFKS